MESTPRFLSHTPSVGSIAPLVAAIALGVILLLHPALAVAQSSQEQARAEEIATNALQRILADAAAPVLQNGTFLKPYQVDANSKLPTPDTNATYLASVPENGIYWLRDPRTLAANRLVKISEGTEAAFDAAKWAYAGQAQDETFHPEHVPQWQPYSEQPDGPVTGRVAYAIWDESGKLDINMAGPDGLTEEGKADPARVNGLAPHNLRLEQLVGNADNLLSYLNGADGKRARSNFSLRNIARDQTNNTGDDRRIFTVRELIRRGHSIPQYQFDVGVASRDFAMKPQWDGARDAAIATAFLKTFVNNGKLFRMIHHPKAGARLVEYTLDERRLISKLRSVIPSADIGAYQDDWMDFMRMLAILRRAYPQATSHGPQFPLPAASLTNDDIYGLALNIIQGTMRPNDINWLYYDRTAYGFSAFNDPNARVGARVTPQIVSTSLRVKRITTETIAVTEYFKLWNPHAVDLSEETYFYGHWAGSTWNQGGYGGALYSFNDRFETSGPKPGQFKVVQLPTKILSVPISLGITSPFLLRARPFLQHKDYYSTLVTTNFETDASVIHGTSGGPVYTAGGSDAGYNLTYYFTGSELAEPGTSSEFMPKWFSFEIDDPRMGGFTRFAVSPYPFAPPNFETQMSYSWKALPGKHSLNDTSTDDGIPSPPDPEMDRAAWKTEWQATIAASAYGKGYNSNFGENFPADWQGEPAEKLARALSTFALPRRQYLNQSDASRVFAQRPWQTLEINKATAALAGELSTLGTTSLDTNLAVKALGELPTDEYHPDLQKRVRDNLVLFDEVDENNEPTGLLRPIRGRFSLNAVRPEALAVVLAAPYRMVGTLANGSTEGEDVYESITPDEALAVAEDLGEIRPIRTLSDLGKLKELPGLNEIQRRYPTNLAEAVLARLIQFGTIRQQTYTVEVISQTLDPANPNIVTGEARRLVTVHLDTYSRRAEVQAVEAGAALPFALDSNLAWSTDPERPWLGQVDASATNHHAARSGRVNPGETTWLEAVVQGPGELRFQHKASGTATPENGDTFHLLLDDAVAADLQGSTEWSEQTLEVPSGSHRVRWSYTAAHSRDDDEGAWIDNVSFTRSNVPPVARDDSARFVSVEVSIPVLANDSDEDGQPLTISSVTEGVHGTTAIVGDSVVYTPGATFQGRDQFTYVVADEAGDTATGMVTIRPAAPLIFTIGETKLPLPGAGEPGGLPAGAIVSKLGLPSASGSWLTTYRAGKQRGQAILAEDSEALSLHTGSPVTDSLGAPMSGLAFASFSEPAFISHTGFALRAKVRGRGIKPQNDEGLWVRHGGKLLQVAMEGGAAPGTNGATIKKIETIGAADSGVVYFTAILRRGGGVDKSNDRGLWAWQPKEAGGGTVTLLLREGAMVDGFATPLSKFHALTPVRGSEAEGRGSMDFARLAVHLSFQDGAQAVTSLFATGEWGEITRSGTQDSEPFAGLSFKSLGVPDESARSGSLTFLAHLPDGRSGIADTRAGLLASSGAPAPGADGTVFSTFADPVADAAHETSHIAFVASLAAATGKKVSNNTGIWAYKPGSENDLVLIARQGGQATGWNGASFQKFHSLAMLPGRGLIFSASVKVQTNGDRGKNGVWAMDDAGELILLLREGQTIVTDGRSRAIRKYSLLSPVAGLGGKGPGVQSTEVVTTRMDFTDGSQAVLKIALP